jgi:hypothetical protein
MVGAFCNDPLWRRIARLLPDAKHFDDWGAFCKAVPHLAVGIVALDESMSRDAGLKVTEVSRAAPFCQLVVVTHLLATNLNILSGTQQPRYVEIEELERDLPREVRTATSETIVSRLAVHLPDELSAPGTRFACEKFFASNILPFSVSIVDQEVPYSLRSLGNAVRADLGLSLGRLRQLRMLIEGLQLAAQGIKPLEISERLGCSVSSLNRAARALVAMTFYEASRLGARTVSSRVLAEVRAHQSRPGRPRHRKVQNPADWM